jgi:hypothetical protein
MNEGHHHLPPAWAVLNLGEGGWLIGAHNVQLLCHQCMRHKPGHPKDVVDAVEVERHIIVVVGIEVVIINIVVNLYVIMER